MGEMSEQTYLASAEEINRLVVFAMVCHVARFSMLTFFVCSVAFTFVGLVAAATWLAIVAVLAMLIDIYASWAIRSTRAAIRNRPAQGGP